MPITDASNKKGCGLSDISLVYDPKTNPTGARCTVTDLRVNIYGRDPKTGFARKPDDNVGVQYGLAALNKKTITADEFLSLNEHVGGNDVDGNFIKARSVGDPDGAEGDLCFRPDEFRRRRPEDRADPRLSLVFRYGERHPQPRTRPHHPGPSRSRQWPVRQSGDLGRRSARTPGHARKRRTWSTCPLWRWTP